MERRMQRERTPSPRKKEGFKVEGKEWLRNDKGGRRGGGEGE